jgi:hypothetical protein
MLVDYCLGRYGSFASSRQHGKHVRTDNCPRHCTAILNASTNGEIGAAFATLAGERADALSVTGNAHPAFGGNDVNRTAAVC